MSHLASWSMQNIELEPLVELLESPVEELFVDPLQNRGETLLHQILPRQNAKIHDNGWKWSSEWDSCSKKVQERNMHMIVQDGWARNGSSK